MIDCAVVGDSLAVGVAVHVPQCARLARVGINTADFARVYRIPSATQVLISLGSNDRSVSESQLREQLSNIRSTVTHGTVTWLISANVAQARRAVQVLAAHWGDRVIDAQPWVGADRVHPHHRGYGIIADQWLRK